MKGCLFPYPDLRGAGSMTVGGNWEKLLPKNARKLRGKIVRFLPEESVKGMVQNGSCPFPFGLIAVSTGRDLSHEKNAFDGAAIGFQQVSPAVFPLELRLYADLSSGEPPPTPA